MKTKLTKTFVEKHPCTGKGQLFIRDTELTGFGLRIGMNSKNYFVEKRINGKSIRKAIGNVEHFTPEEARKRAQVMLGKMADGVNPVEEKKAKAYARTTLQEAFDTYKKTRTLSPKTITGMTYNLNQVFNDWLEKPLSTV